MSVRMMKNTLGPMPQAVDAPSLSSLFLPSHWLPLLCAHDSALDIPGQPSGTLVLKALFQIDSGHITQ